MGAKESKTCGVARDFLHNAIQRRKNQTICSQLNKVYSKDQFYLLT